jgi:glutathione peroxidase
MTLHDFTARLADGTEQPLEAYRGQALLLVNTASRCGFTPQYAALQELHARFAPRGFAVLGFPCNQFGGQEPGSEPEIAAFCDTRFGVTFPLFAKVEVNGARAHPLWAWLRRQKGGLITDAIKWNFTKFLVDGAGRVVSRHPPTTAPQALAPAIEALLPRAGSRG